MKRVLAGFAAITLLAWMAFHAWVIVQLVDAEVMPALEADAFFKKVVDSQKAWCEQVVYFTLLASPDYRLAYQHYYPGKI